jgi:hypothetical protein
MEPFVVILLHTTGWNFVIAVFLLLSQREHKLEPPAQLADQLL